MLTAIVTGPDLFSAKRQIKNAKEADAIEIRLDYLDAIDLVKIKKLQEYSNKTIIFTLSRKAHGGKYVQPDKKLYYDLRRLFALKPNYFDLEYDIDQDFLKEMNETHPEVKIICSYHNFESTPNLEETLQSIKNPFATFYKIAAYTQNSLEALKMLDFLKSYKGNDLIIIPIGEKGSFVRVISKIYGNKITYAYVDKKNALGQVSIDDLVNVYNYKSINEKTKIVALLGHPLKGSLSHVFHNSIFSKNNKNVVYIKINLQRQDLPIFFSYIKIFAFRGFSVTMPLKESVLTFIDEDLAKVGSINTILVEDSKLIGFNTDGKAALDAIERKVSVKSKKILLIGAGGVAKAIAHEAIKRGANLIIFNRDQKKSFDLATKLQCKSYPLESVKDVMKEGYHVIINATSASMDDINVIPKECLIESTIALDVVSRPVETVFLKNAQDKKCLVIYGMEMFLNQAKLQFQDL